MKPHPSIALARGAAAAAGLAPPSPRTTLPAQAAKYGPGASATEIKLGQTMPYSGPASAYGTIGKVEQAYFKMINDNGGINGRKINLISLDDGYSPPKTVEQVRRLVEQDEVLALFQTLGTPTQLGDPQVRQRQEGAAPAARHRRHEVGRSEALPVDDGLQPELPVRRPDLRQVPAQEQAEREDRDPLPERRLRQGRAEGREGRPRRGAREDDRRRGDLRGHRPDGRFADRSRCRARAPTPSSTSRRRSSRAQAIRKAYDSGWKPLHIINNVGASVGSVLVPAGLDKSVGADDACSTTRTRTIRSGRTTRRCSNGAPSWASYYRDGDPKDASQPVRLPGGADDGADPEAVRQRPDARERDEPGGQPEEPQAAAAAAGDDDQHQPDRLRRRSSRPSWRASPARSGKRFGELISTDAK